MDDPLLMVQIKEIQRYIPVTLILHSCPECGHRLEMDDDLYPDRYACPTGCGHVEKGVFMPISNEISMDWVDIQTIKEVRNVRM